MIIDLHFHTAAYSGCSAISLESGLAKARDMGVDGICLTEHNVFADYGNLDALGKAYNLRIFVGTEILTCQGDILCFGLDEIPKSEISAQELLCRMEALGGATIAAHPYRENGRGLGNLAGELSNLTAVEAYNGNTRPCNNGKAIGLSLKTGLPMTGGSDAHSLNRVGVYATRFDAPVESMADLVSQLRGGQFRPVIYEKELKRFSDLPVRLDCTHI